MSTSATIRLELKATMSRSRAKGTAAETATVKALWRLGFPYAERRALSGSSDRGDIGGTIGLCWEVKDAKTWKVAEWMRETETERVNSGADYGILVIKAPGVGAANADRWLTVMDSVSATRLVGQAMERRPQVFRVVDMPAVGIAAGLAQLVERERHCGLTPVNVRVRKRLTAVDRTPGFYDLMRLDVRCRLLVDAGYGGGIPVSSLMQQHETS